MRCESCGNDYPSKYYFATRTLCRDCFGRLSPAAREQVAADIEDLPIEGARRRTIDGHALRCPVCAHDEFWRRKTLMNTPGLTFLGLEWANREADNYVCASCGHVLWFLREKEADRKGGD